jgi:anti-anti-sigma regulatory factor
LISRQGPPSTIVVGLTGWIDPAEIPQLCRRVRFLVESGSTDLIVDVGALLAPDMVTVEALARMQLTARRLGREIRVEHACHRLAELLVLTGLAEVFPPAGG